MLLYSIVTRLVRSLAAVEKAVIILAVRLLGCMATIARCVVLTAPGRRVSEHLDFVSRE
jgi:hypothetical protein